MRSQSLSLNYDTGAGREIAQVLWWEPQGMRVGGGRAVPSRGKMGNCSQETRHHAGQGRVMVFVLLKKILLNLLG